MRDVYAGDDDQTRAQPDALHPDVLFIVEADPDPDALVRISGIVSLTNRALLSGHMITDPAGRLSITLEVSGVPVATQELIRRKLQQLTCVTAADVHVVHRGPTPGSIEKSQASNKHAGV